MPVELTYLVLSALLAASLWIPFIVGVNMHPVQGNPFERPPDLNAFPAWVHRAHRAHLNMVESLVPFAVVVLIAHSLAVSSTCLLYTSPSPRDLSTSRMPSSA